MKRVFILLSAFLFSAAALAESQIVIDSIEIEGVKSLPAADTQSAIEVSPGDFLERSRVVRSAKNIQTMLYLKGYQDVSVKSDLVRVKGQGGQTEITLRFLVDEGKPSRIASVKLTPILQRGQSFNTAWSVVETDLLNRLPLKKNELLDQDKISEARRIIENVLSSQEYVGAKASDVRLEVSPQAVESPFSQDTQRWYNVEMKVELGDRVTFGFLGNQVLTRNELLRVVDAQRLVGFGSDYITSIKNRIEDTYRQRGYANVTVIARTFEKPAFLERHITYEINEGDRVKISSVSFDGNSAFSDKELQEYFYQSAPYLIQKNIYVEKDVDRATEFLSEKLQSMGYLFARATAVSKTFLNSKKNAVRLLIYVNEGEQTLVRSIVIEGAFHQSKEEILATLKVQEGQPLNLFALSEGIEKLKSEYRSKGFLEMTLLNEQDDSVVRYSNRNRQADILLKLQEGREFRIGQITLYGLEKTFPYIITRELQFKEGDILENVNIVESEKRLRRLGIFASVTMEYRDSPNRPGYKDVNVILQEGSPGKVAGGIGVRNDLGARVFGETSYGNLWKRNHTWSFNANANRRFESYCRNGVCFAEYQARMGYIWPWFGIDELTFRPEITHERRRYREFDADTTLLNATWERRLLKYVNLVGVFNYSLERTRQFNALFDEDRQTLLIGAITPSLRLDLRDDSLSPTRGFFGVVSHEIASTTYGSQRTPFPIGYTRSQLRADYFVPLAPKVTWFLSFRTGFERNTENPILSDGSRDRRIAIPLIKQFSLGGVSSLRGFKLQELNLQKTAIQGTASYVNYRTQVDLPFIGDLRFGPFMDAGNLLIDHYSLGALRYGVGFGFHYSTPVGPVNFDWGFKVDPLPGEDTNQFYFSLGII